MSRIELLGEGIIVFDDDGIIVLADEHVENPCPILNPIAKSDRPNRIELTWNALPEHAELNVSQNGNYLQLQPHTGRAIISVEPTEEDILFEFQVKVDSWSSSESITLKHNPDTMDVVMWTSSSDGFWMDPSNWLPNRIPCRDTVILQTEKDDTVRSILPANAKQSVIKLTFEENVLLDFSDNAWLNFVLPDEEDPNQDSHGKKESCFPLSEVQVIFNSFALGHHKSKPR